MTHRFKKIMVCCVRRMPCAECRCATGKVLLFGVGIFLAAWAWPVNIGKNVRRTIDKLQPAIKFSPLRLLALEPILVFDRPEE